MFDRAANKDADENGDGTIDTSSHAGRREFTGYRMILDEYIANEQAIYDSELSQRVQVQMKEWNLRERALQERYNAWDKRMQTVLERGTKSWGASEQEFTFKWREWRKKQDQQEAEARELWDQRTKDHFTAKTEWHGLLGAPPPTPRLGTCQKGPAARMPPSKSPRFGACCDNREWAFLCFVSLGTK